MAVPFLFLVLTACKKQDSPRTSHLPSKIYITDKENDTTNAIVLEYQYSPNDYLVSRLKRRGDTILEKTAVSYDSRQLVSKVSYESPTERGNYELVYNSADSSSLMAYSSFTTSNGKLLKYGYTRPTNEMLFQYSSGTPGRVLTILDSTFEANRFTQKKKETYAYGRGSNDTRDVYVTSEISYPGTSVVSTSSELYTYNYDIQNPFSYAYPDFIQLPPVMRDISPFNRAGVLSSYQIGIGNSVTSRDTYLYSKFLPGTNLPQVLSRTNFNLRTGAITYTYYYISYK